MTCTWPGCEEPTIVTWFCQEHYRLKEACYALTDLDRDTPGFHDVSILRLRQYVEYRLGLEDEKLSRDQHAAACDDGAT